MKNTPFTHKHLELGAKMAEFAGYNMPISYTGINDEHLAVRNNAGIFDVSHMGEFILKGPGALDLIQQRNFQRCIQTHRTARRSIVVFQMKREESSMTCWFIASKKRKYICWL